MSPPPIEAPGLTEAIATAAELVAMLYARYTPVAGAELQLAIYPWKSGGDVTFDIEQQLGGFRAHDIQGSGLSIEGHTLEDLVTAVGQLPDCPTDKVMFRWVREVATLPTSGSLPPSGNLA